MGRIRIRLRVRVRVRVTVIPTLSRALIHHDLKSANVMVFPKAGGAYGAKLIDFGESRGTGITTNTRGASADDGLRGTEGYKAPEQSPGNGYTHRARCDPA